MSLFETFTHGEYVYFDSAVMLLFFLLIGRYLDSKTKGKARETAKKLLSMFSGTATILKGKTRVTVPIRELHEGMRVIVSSGENIPADGVVTEGESDIDMSLITGETLPHPIKKDSAVFAGTLNLSAPIQFTVSKANDKSLLSDIIKLMEKAEQNRSRYVRLADKAASLYTPIFHILAAITFLGWWLIMQAPWQVSLLYSITVLIITCPCALGLAVPVVQVLASTKLMKYGILLKSGDALEKMAGITHAALDKTGTLTLGRPQLLKGKHTQKELQLAASLAAYSKHPLSRAITTFYDGELYTIENIKEVPGKGIEGKYKGKTVKLGRRNWCGDKSTKSQKHTQLEMWLSVQGKSPALFAFSDELRKDASDIVRKLQAHNIHTVLLSGDRKEVVEKVAKESYIAEYRAELSPTEKYDHLETLKKQGNHVLMVGDGLNDAPSLATASVSMSPSTALDITQNTADIVFQGDSLLPIYITWNVARTAKRLVKENFALAILYNIIAIPLAITGHVTPLIAAVAMSASSLVVISNSFRLNLIKST